MIVNELLEDINQKEDEIHRNKDRNEEGYRKKEENSRVKDETHKKKDPPRIEMKVRIERKGWRLQRWRIEGRKDNVLRS